jgi:hypothetical protein
MMKIEGTVSNGSESVPAYISVIDVLTQKRYFSGCPDPDGSYFFYLKEGSVYEVAFDPEQSQKTFLVKSYDLTGDKIAQREKLDVVLKTPQPGDEFQLEGVAFTPQSSTITPASEDVLKRVIRLMKANPGLGFEIQVLLNGYRESEVRSDPDLTEQYTVIDSVAHYELITHDTVRLTEERVDKDSLLSLIIRDSVLTYSQRERIIYHNDRTIPQSESIVDYLIQNGVTAHQVPIMVNAIEMPGEPRTTVRIRVFSLKDRQ